jgi:Mg-chelatase subunit ChlD
MQNKAALFAALLACFNASIATAQETGSGATTPNGLQIEIQSPTPDYIANAGENVIEVEGVASTIGGVKYLDMIFVMDTSTSLRSTDPKDFRSAGAVGLVEKLSPRSDIKIGVVSFDSRGELVQPMTSDRKLVAQALRDMPRSGSTNLAAGIKTALKELRAHGRPNSSRVIMLFTDGQSNRRAAHAAAVEAHGQGATIQTLLLGSSRTGSEILDEISWATGGSLVRLSVNGSPPVPAKLAGGTFIGSLPVETGENRIVAFATSIDGRTQETAITVMVQDASCAALEVAAVKSGREVVSLGDKSVEIVVDASRSMWGRMHGEPKMSVAKEILWDVSHWFPEDLNLALRAYGSTSPSESTNCADSALLVPFADDNRGPIRAAVEGLRPLGQTPIAYALEQASRDFGTRTDDRAVVLVTDGIESCGGDPVQAARELRDQGIIVHVIGFGLGNVADEDSASLQNIAWASGGQYVTAGSAEELKAALARTVATSYSVYKGSTQVAGGSLGSDAPIYLPEGDYRVELHSSPPRSMPVSLAPRDRVSLTLEKAGDAVSHYERRDQIGYRSCEDVVAKIERLEAGRESLHSAAEDGFPSNAD